MTAKPIKVAFHSGGGWETIPMEYNPTCVCESEPDTCHCWGPRKVTPDGTYLRRCAVHSGVSESGRPQEEIFAEFADGNYACFFDDGECFDDCWSFTKETQKAVEQLQISVPIAKPSPSRINYADLHIASKLPEPHMPSNRAKMEASLVEFHKFVQSVKELEAAFLVLHNEMTRQAFTLGRFTEEPMYKSQKAVATAKAAEYSRLRKLAEARGEPHAPEVVAAQRESDLAQRKLDDWVNKTGKQKVEAAFNAKASQASDAGMRLKKAKDDMSANVTPMFYHIYNEYLHANRHERTEIHQKLMAFREYIPEPEWPSRYIEHSRKLDSERESLEAYNRRGTSTRVMAVASLAGDFAIGADGQITAAKTGELVVATPALGAITALPVAATSAPPPRSGFRARGGQRPASDGNK